MSFKKFNQYLSERYKGKQAMDGNQNRAPLSEPDMDANVAKYYAPEADRDHYRMVNGGKDPKGKPLAGLESPGFEKPDSVIPGGEKPDWTPPRAGTGKKIKVENKKVKAENFLQKTKNMSDVEFAKHLLKQSGSLGENSIDAIRTLQHAAKLCATNETAMTRFVRELKNFEGLETLCHEMLSHQEGFQAIREALDGQLGKYAQSQMLSIVERVTKPRITPPPQQQAPPGGTPNNQMPMQGGMDPSMGMGSGTPPGPDTPDGSGIGDGQTPPDDSGYNPGDEEHDDEDEHEEGEEGEEGHEDSDEEEGDEDEDEMDDPSRQGDHGQKANDLRAQLNMQQQNFPRKGMM